MAQRLHLKVSSATLYWSNVYHVRQLSMHRLSASSDSNISSLQTSIVEISIIFLIFYKYSILKHHTTCLQHIAHTALAWCRVVKITQLNNITGKKKLKQLVNQLLKFAAKKTHTKIWITTQKSYAIIKMEESTALVDLLTNNYTRLIQQTLSTTALTEQ